MQSSSPVDSLNNLSTPLTVSASSSSTSSSSVSSSSSSSSSVNPSSNSSSSLQILSVTRLSAEEAARSDQDNSMDVSQDQARDFNSYFSSLVVKDGKNFKIEFYILSSNFMS